MPDPTELEEMRRELEEIMRKNREAFEGTYKKEIDELLGLSRADVDAMVPGTEDLATYDALIEAVKEASRRNDSQALLKARVEALGEIAVAIARRIPSLAALLA
jgi:hypothetical protein